MSPKIKYKISLNKAFNNFPRKKWSHDDLLTPRFQNGSCLQKTTVNIDKERKRDPMVNSLQN